ncbi:MAG: hypothetical protein BGO67_04300 [Alphaproteobacteria bacterium 41-28]|nr:MAG: hypothetical protein BGO67_04300 [Alphaproteobacteria bacterium 41-28]
MKDKLTPEDLQLWQANVKDVKPLSKKVPKRKEPPVAKIRTPQKPPLKRIVKISPSLAPLQNLGRKELRHLKIDARLDMHGLSLEEGFDALERFLVRSQERGLKNVLVITGKGALSAENTLRHQFPRWLEETPLRELITSYHPAKPQDGGSGAFYVGIRKRVKK